MGGHGRGVGEGPRKGEEWWMNDFLFFSFSGWMFSEEREGVWEEGDGGGDCGGEE